MLTTVTNVDVSIDRSLTLVGTAHVSEDSADEVQRVLNEQRPDVVGIEVGLKRYRVLLKQIHGHDPSNGTSLFKRVQEKIGRKFGVQPGVEVRRAITTAHDLGCAVAPIDREFDRTQERLKEQMGWFEFGRIGIGMVRILLQDMGSLPSLDDIRDEIDQQGGMDGMLEQMSDVLPGLYSVLVDERNAYMAHRLKTLLNRDNDIVAVVGSAHVSGIKEYFNEQDESESR